MYIPKKYQRENFYSNDLAAFGVMTKEERRKWEMETNRLIRNVKPIDLENKKKGKPKKELTEE